MKVLLVHDWLIHMRGGEKVLETIAEIFPEAEIFTLFYDRSKLSPALQKRRIQASFLHNLPGIRRYYRWLLPVLPWVIGSMRLPEVDLVISTSHCVAKGIPIPKGACHICYCHTPMRYLWGFEEEYFGNFPAVIKIALRGILACLRIWDLKSNTGVDRFVANSENVKRRIEKYYRRNSEVIYPPLDDGFFKPDGQQAGFYLIVSAFVPYKKVDMVIRTFNDLDRELCIVGEGPLEKEYRRICRSGKIKFRGAISGEKLRRLYSEARALIFPTDEDFGIVPLEAQACGTPVIAYAKGGALESVQSGVFFDEQNPESLRQAVIKFENMTFERPSIAEKVQRFGKNYFKQKFRNYIQQTLQQRNTHVFAKT